MIENIEFIYGCMFSGKTGELLRRIKREEIAGKHVQLFKPSIDDRYSIEEIVTHDGYKHQAIRVPNTKALIENLDHHVEIIGIDEIQFFDSKIIKFCLKEADLGKKIICAGLNFDGKAKPFRFKNSKKHVGELIVISKPTLLTAICTYDTGIWDKIFGAAHHRICGKDAYFTQRLVKAPKGYKEGDTLIGGKEMYAPRCLTHFIPHK